MTAPRRGSVEELHASVLGRRPVSEWSSRRTLVLVRRELDQLSKLAGDVDEALRALESAPVGNSVHGHLSGMRVLLDALRERLREEQCECSVMLSTRCECSTCARTR